MDTVTTLPRGRAFTNADLAAMPDDGNRYELLDGALIVTPSPSRRHQRVSAALYRVLQAACPGELFVLTAPVDFVVADDATLQPDLVVVDRSVAYDEDAPLGPHLVVEILSPSTRTLDRHAKHSRYAAAGVPSYWVVDPGLDEAPPSITAWRLRGGGYVEVGRAVGDAPWTSTAPYAVTVTPSALL